MTETVEASGIAETLKAVCAEHRLDAISVTFNADFKVNFVTVFVHPDNDGLCSAGSGANFADALADALATMSQRQTEAA